MFLDIAVLIVIATARWHQARRHDQQVAAAHQTLAHLQTAYRQAAAGPLAALAQRQPPARAVERHAQRILVILPDHAQQVLDDPAWPALAAVLTEAENSGHDPEQLTARRTPAHPRRRPLHRQDPHLARPTPRRPAGSQRPSTGCPSPHQRCSPAGTAWPDSVQPVTAWQGGTCSTPVMPSAGAEVPAASTLQVSHTEGTASPHRVDQRLQQVQCFLPAEAVRRAAGPRPVRFAGTDQDTHPP